MATVALVLYFVLPLDGKFAEVLAGLLVVATVGSMVPLAVHRARRIMASSEPLLDALESIFTAVTLMVVSFSAVHYVLGTQHQDQIDGIVTKIDALYFEVTILSTVGFGDITAVGQLARGLVVANMLLNVVLLGIAVRVVSWAFDAARKQRSATSA